jgi:hypothetical protein
LSILPQTYVMSLFFPYLTFLFTNRFYYYYRHWRPFTTSSQWRAVSTLSTPAHARCTSAQLCANTLLGQQLTAVRLIFHCRRVLPASAARLGLAGHQRCRVLPIPWHSSRSRNFLGQLSTVSLSSIPSSTPVIALN